MAEDRIDINVINDKELLNLFDELDKKVQDKILLEGFKKSVKMILDAAKSNFDSIKKNQSKTDYTYVNKGWKVEPLANQIGVKFGNKNYKSKWINWGTKERFYKTKKGNMHSTGLLKRTNFFFDAVESKGEEAQNMLSTHITQALDKTVKKYEKK